MLDKLKDRLRPSKKLTEQQHTDIRRILIKLKNGEATLDYAQVKIAEIILREEN